MDKICQYSTIIFASNVSVLLIVSVCTDYWEYRGFQLDTILDSVHESNSTKLHNPGDTNSYYIIRYLWDRKAKDFPTFPPDIVHYQSPALVYKYFTRRQHTYNRTVFDGTVNVTSLVTETHVERFQDVIVLFVQYGNLYRECDSLEYLERTAFTFAVLCIIASVVSVVAGARGSLGQHKQSIIAASTAALVSGVSLTVSIALFHGKCHLLHRRELMAGEEIPYKKILNDSRVHHYGWSFVLAWICVGMCFIHTWVWLKEAQDMDTRGKCHRHNVRQAKVNWVTELDDMTGLDL